MSERAEKEIAAHQHRHERLVAKLRQKAVRMKDIACANYLFVQGEDHRAPWGERERMGEVVAGFRRLSEEAELLVKQLSGNSSGDLRR